MPDSAHIYSLCPYFVSFIFPQEVNEMWAGLGYYRRARFLLEVFFFKALAIIFIFRKKRLSLFICISNLL